MITDRQLTSLQQTGRVSVSCLPSNPPKLAELVEACDTLGIKTNEITISADQGGMLTLICD